MFSSHDILLWIYGGIHLSNILRIKCFLLQGGHFCREIQWIASTRVINIQQNNFDQAQLYDISKESRHVCTSYERVQTSNDKQLSPALAPIVKVGRHFLTNGVIQLLGRSRSVCLNNIWGAEILNQENLVVLGDHGLLTHLIENPAPSQGHHLKNQIQSSTKVRLGMMTIRKTIWSTWYMGLREKLCLRSSNHLVHRVAGSLGLFFHRCTVVLLEYVRYS